jgi:hypothetical protein
MDITRRDGYKRAYFHGPEICHGEQGKRQDGRDMVPAVGKPARIRVIGNPIQSHSSPMHISWPTPQL